jgi:peptide-methionine (R)-S-oxide reductase
MSSPENTDPAQKTDEQWRAELSDEQYRILRQGGTERPFTGPYVQHKEPGVYRCVACGTELFASGTKFDSGSGWPSFYDVMDKGNVTLHRDASHGMVRTEVRCAGCGGHLGHVFEDGPRPTGLRYCINGACLQHEPGKPEA